MQRHLRSASRPPFGPGREHEEKVNELHQKLLRVERRIGTTAERPGDLGLAEKIAHDLRGKLTISLLREEIRLHQAQPGKVA